MTDWLKKNGSKILTGLGSFGFLTTVALTARAAIKVDKKIFGMIFDRVYEKENKHLDRVEPISTKDYYPTAKEVAKECWKDILPPAATTVVSLGCFWGAEIMNNRQINALTATCAMLVESHNLWKQRTGDLVGPEFKKEVLKNAQAKAQDDVEGNPPWDERQTFYIEGFPKFFETTMEEVMKAEYTLNRMFVLRGYVTTNEFLELLRQDRMDGGDDIGWDAESGECFYGYQWIDFTHKHRILDDGMQVCEISMPFSPHHLFEADDEYEEQALRNK